MVRAVKLAILATARALGAFALASGTRWRRRRLVILCYHGFSLEDEHEWDPRMYMTRERFRERLVFLRDHGYSVLPLGESLDRLRAGTLPSKAIAITVDDGTYDFYRQALPVTEELGFPVTLYLTTYYCCYPEPVFNGICSYMLWKARHRTLEMERLGAGDEVYPLAGSEGRTAALEELLTYAQVKNLGAADKNALARRLAEHLDIDYDALRARRIIQLMRPEEVRDAARRGVDIQLHTHRHRVPLHRVLFGREIEDNHTQVVQMTGRAPAHFCYPNGAYRGEFPPWLRELGVVSATTCEWGLAGPQTNLYRLPRVVDTSTLTLLEFEAWLTGAAEFLPARGNR